MALLILINAHKIKEKRGQQCTEIIYCMSLNLFIEYYKKYGLH